LEHHGFAVGVIATLLLSGFAKWRPVGGRGGGFVVKITSAGRKIIGE
jgi:hypothetical protein